MGNNIGKNFELRFKQDWEKSFPDSFLLRLYDTTNGFSNVNNPCDYLAFIKGKLFMIECKSHDGSSIPFTAIPQYERLLKYKNFKDVFPGVLVWYKEKNWVYWYPILELEKIYNTGHKSLNPEKLIKEGFNLINIPSVKKRVFMESDYSILTK